MREQELCKWRRLVLTCAVNFIAGGSFNSPRTSADYVGSDNVVIVHDSLVLTVNNCLGDLSAVNATTNNDIINHIVQ